MNEIIAKLLSLKSSAFYSEQTSPTQVTLYVNTLKVEQKRILVPFVYELAMTIQVNLLPKQRYRYTGVTFEKELFSFSQESFRGRRYYKEFGKYVTFDGITTVSFDSKPIFKMLDEILVEAGWKYKL